MKSLKLIVFLIFAICFGTNNSTSVQDIGPKQDGPPELEQLQQKGRKVYELGCISIYCFNVVCYKDKCTYLSFVVHTPQSIEMFYLKIAEHFTGVKNQELEGQEEIEMGCPSNICFGVVCDEDRNCTRLVLYTYYLQVKEKFYLEIVQEFSLLEKLVEGKNLYNLGCISLYCFGAICDNEEEHCENFSFISLFETGELYLQIADHVSYRWKL